MPKERQDLMRSLVQVAQKLSVEQLRHLVRLAENWSQRPDSELRCEDRGKEIIDWPHAPLHVLTRDGRYFVSGGTYYHQHFFSSRRRLGRLQELLLSCTRRYGWILEAWALFSNHYHIVVHAAEDAAPLADFIRQFHRLSARYVNELDGTPQRRVWHNYWEKLLTYRASYLARLVYVHRNPERHGLVDDARKYPWCSAAWFDSRASSAQKRMLRTFKPEYVREIDNWDPIFPTGLTQKKTTRDG